MTFEGLAAEEWPEPAPLEPDGPPPPFPTDALPEPIRSFCEATAEALQVPPDATALLSLACLATACARTARIQAAPGWIEPLNLYIALALPSGSRKSAVVSACTAALEEWERSETDRQRPEIAEYAARRETLQARLLALTRKAANADAAARRDAERERDDAARELAVLPERHAPRLLVDDATPEVLARLMAEQSGRIADLSAEGAVLFDMAGGRYSDTGAKLDVYLKAHAGDTLRVDRIGRAPDYVSDPALTLALCMQPRALDGAMARPDFKGRGLLARFLWSVPTPTIGYRKLDPEPVPRDLTRRYREVLFRLLDRTPSDDPPVIALNADAGALFRSFREAVENDLRPEGCFEHLTDWGSKLPGLVLRIAALMHLVRHPDTRPVDEETLSDAVRIGQYAAAHALRVFGLMGADPAQSKASALLRWIVRNDLAEFSTREAMRACRATFPTAADLKEALDVLTETGHVRELQPDLGAPGRPIRRFVVNPRTPGQKGQNGQKLPPAGIVSVLSFMSRPSEPENDPFARYPDEGEEWEVPEQ